MSYAIRHPMGCACGVHGLGELVTPEGLDSIFTSTRSEREAWLSQINQAVTALSNDIVARRSAFASSDASVRAANDRFITDWTAFKNDWGRWYSGVVDSALLTGFNRQQEFVNRYNPLERRFTEITGAAPTRAFAPAASEHEGPWSNQNLMIWAGLGILGLGMAGWILSNLTVWRRSMPLNNNRRRRRRRS